MKRATSLIVFIFIISCSFAQVQRKSTTINKTDSTITGNEKKTVTRGDKKQMMKELDLTREQKIKLKEMRQLAQSKKEAIENDDKLSAPEKETKLKELRKEQAKNTLYVLSPEQKQKMLQLRKEKKSGQMNEMENE